MATSPVEKSGELKEGETQKNLPTPFLTKTYQIVNDPSLDDMISWNENGSAFVIWKPAEFARDLLPKYFKHNNFSSFIRQLNIYRFKKTVPDRWEFANDYFRRGNKSLLREIHRRKISIAPSTPPPPEVTTAIPLVSPGNSSEELGGSPNSSPIATDLLEENKRLKEQNSNLRCELDHVRSLCSSVVSLMSNFISKPPETHDGRSSEKEVEEEMSPRLFGVPIGVKRVRRSEENKIEEKRDDTMIEEQKFM